MMQIDVPDPPSQSAIQVERGPDEVVLASHSQSGFGAAGGCALKAFAWAWNGFCLLMLAFSIFFLGLMVRDVLAGNPGAPHGWQILAALGFLAVFLSILGFFMYIGLRLHRVASGRTPLVGWQLRLEREGWHATRHFLGRTTEARCAPRQVEALTFDVRQQLVARTAAGDRALTTPLAGHDAEWLRQTLGGMIDMPAPRDQAARDLTIYPHVPASVTEAGHRLAWRLASEGSEAKNMLFLLCFGLIWNVVTGVGAGIAVHSHFTGNPEWCLTIFMIPFVLVGLGVIVGFFHQLLVAAGVGPTVVELSDHPLAPGSEALVFVSQSGNLTMNALRVLLVCEESATYRQGTSTRTETKRVCEHELFRREGFRIDKGMPFETECALRVPPGAMHSFEAPRNQIKWKLVVHGDVANWPDFNRAFPVVVLPPAAKEVEREKGKSGK